MTKAGTAAMAAADGVLATQPLSRRACGSGWPCRTWHLGGILGAVGVEVYRIPLDKWQDQGGE